MGQNLDATSDSNSKIRTVSRDGVLQHFADSIENLFVPGGSLGVTWKSLSVRGVGNCTPIYDNVCSQFAPENIFRHLKPLSSRLILDNTHGCVKPGEMLLVAGGPGSGSKALLNILANRRRGYASVDGHVWYGSMKHGEAEKYRGHIVMCDEKDDFHPTLTVEQILDFALKLKIPVQQTRTEIRALLIETLCLEQILSKKIAVLSTGERKLVAIAECMATQGSVFCWDNSTNGLDSRTAFEVMQIIRRLTDVLNLSTIVTLHQAGDAIYNLFDKVLVLEQGKQVIFGSAKQAKACMSHLGVRIGSNIIDSSTNTTVPSIDTGHIDKVSSCACMLRKASERLSTNLEIWNEDSYPESEEARQGTHTFKKSIHTRHVPGFATQIVACTRREYQTVWSNKKELVLNQLSTVGQALVAGSLFYEAPGDTSGFSYKTGAMFFSMLFHSLAALAVVSQFYLAYPILVKDSAFAFYDPTAFCIAQILVDFPLIIMQVSIFSIPFYFLVGFTVSPSAFFIYWMILISMSICLVALFRLIGAMFRKLNASGMIAGIVSNVTITYCGYVVSKPQMVGWMNWLFWVSPCAWAYEALMASELRGKTLPCVKGNLIPSGPGYSDPAHQSCIGVGGVVKGRIYVEGDLWLSSQSFSPSHIWRNIGIMWASWAFSVFLYRIIVGLRLHDIGDRSLVIFPKVRASLTKMILNDFGTPDETPTTTPTRPLSQSHTDANGTIKSDFSRPWKQLTFDLKSSDRELNHRNSVQGWVKPGMLLAVMCTSGTENTALLETLAQYKHNLNGSILLDGCPLPASRQELLGYCQLVDVHEPYATVREALEFSAILRQSGDTPHGKKIEYVDEIIELLELQDIADYLIGVPGDGLPPELRKRVSLAIELVAKPGILLLDQPTLGLDDQAASDTIRFLRKLADAGLGIVVAVYQPSAEAFAMFDSLLLLNKGRTIYFGDTGVDGGKVKAYLGERGAPCPKEGNEAEYLMDVTWGHVLTDRDWHQEWLQSSECAAVTENLSKAASMSRTISLGHVHWGPIMPPWIQFKILLQRMNLSLFRNVNYVNNRLLLHVVLGLFNGFSFWKLGISASDQQLHLSTTFNFIFVAPAAVAALQPLFIERRQLFEAREKRMYGWFPLVTSLIVSEIPYIVLCTVLYFLCWYYTVGLPADSHRAGGIFFTMLMYGFIYTSVGQLIAACSTNALMAALLNPFILGNFVAFCGILVPYAQLHPFWRYWAYYIDPFTYMVGSLMIFILWGYEVICNPEELAVFNPPSGQSCGEYMSDYYIRAKASPTARPVAHLLNPDAMTNCEVCPFRTGNDWLYGRNLTSYSHAWRDGSIVALLAIGSYAMIYVVMKARYSKQRTIIANRFRFRR